MTVIIPLWRNKVKEGRGRDRKPFWRFWRKGLPALDWTTTSAGFTYYLFMNIHEYQAKQLFDAAGVAVPAGAVAQNPDEFDTAIASFPERVPP